MSTSNGHTITSTTIAQLEDKVARYRTALVALVARLKRHSREYATWDDQQLIRQVEAMLDEDDVPTKKTEETRS